MSRGRRGDDNRSENLFVDVDSSSAKAVKGVKRKERQAKSKLHTIKEMMLGTLHPVV